MATASVRTILPLDRFTRVVSYSPMLFSQVFVPDLQPPVACSDPVLQYTWQTQPGGAPGREEIAQAIAQAEDIITQYLGFPPGVKWVTDEEVALPIRPRPNAWWNRWPAGQTAVKAKYGWVVGGGIEAYAAIQLAAAITYTDLNNDGYNETATVTVNTTVTNPDEVVVYYPGSSHDPAWELRPIGVSIANGVATITFERHQAVKPELITALNATGVSGLDDSKFLTTVDVYRQYADPSVMGRFEWLPGICCTDSGGLIYTQTASLTPMDARNGLVVLRAGDWDATNQVWTAACPNWWLPPMRARLWYRAGYRDASSPRPNHTMTLQMEQAVTFLALSYMDRIWESCEPLRNLQIHWREDLAVRISSPAQSSSVQLSRGLLDNPLGTTRAAIFAWRVVQKLMLGEASVA